MSQVPVVMLELKLMNVFVLSSWIKQGYIKHIHLLCILIIEFLIIQLFKCINWARMNCTQVIKLTWHLLKSTQYSQLIFIQDEIHTVLGVFFFSCFFFGALYVFWKLLLTVSSKKAKILVFHNMQYFYIYVFLPTEMISVVKFILFTDGNLPLLGIQCF